MPRIRIKRIPGDVYEVLMRRATGAGVSLEDYVRQRLVEGACTPRLDELFRDRPAQGIGNVPLVDAANVLRADRHQR